MIWNSDSILRLRELRTSGKSFLECAIALGVSRNVVAGKCHRLGIPSPSSKRKRFEKTVQAAKAARQELINPAVNAHKRDLYADLRRAVENTK